MSAPRRTPLRAYRPAGAFAVVVTVGPKRGAWGTYPTRDAAERAAILLRLHGLDAIVSTVDSIERA